VAAPARGAPIPLSQRFRKPVWYALSCLILLFYLWTATSSYRPFHPRDTSSEFYNQLTSSFLKGHLYLAARPSPQMLALPNPYDPAANERFRLHDASLYHGRYYVYFGVAPVVTLYLPWRVFTGKPLSDDVAVTLFAMGGYVFSCLLLFLLLRALRVRVAWFLQIAAVLVLALGQAAPMVLRRPRVYEVAVSAAFCFLLGGLYFLAARVVRPGAWRFLPALGAISLGLAAASRPQCALVAVLAGIAYGVHLARVRGLRGRSWLAEFARFALPLSLAGLLIAWYNYARFGNPLEFGINYQVAGIDFRSGSGSLAARAQEVFASLCYLLVCPPSFLPRFPFFELSGAALPLGDPALLPKRFYPEPLAGVLLISPLWLAGLALPLVFWKDRRIPAHIRAIPAVLAAAGLVMLASVCSLPGVSARYLLDFVPVVLLAGLFLCLWLTVRLPSRWMRAAAVALTFAGCIWASAVGAALSVNSYGYPLEQSNSTAFRSLAGFFGAGQDAFIEDVDRLRFDAMVTFPRAQPEVRETLLASGIYERWDLLYVKYETAGRVIFSFVHSGVSDTQTPAIPISFDAPHHLSVDYSAAARRLLVYLDGQSVIDYSTGFFPTSRDRVTIGHMGVGRFHLRDFTGRIDAGMNLHAGPSGLNLVTRPAQP